jgi:trehalose/maltose hydrolase-like predicted phosphorylase
VSEATPAWIKVDLLLSTRMSAGDNHAKTRTTVSNGYLGSRNDEERSEMRYVMRIAEFSESSNL